MQSCFVLHFHVGWQPSAYHHRARAELHSLLMIAICFGLVQIRGSSVWSGEGWGWGERQYGVWKEQDQVVEKSVCEKIGGVDKEGCLVLFSSGFGNFVTVHIAKPLRKPPFHLVILSILTASVATANLRPWPFQTKSRLNIEDVECTSSCAVDVSSCTDIHKLLMMKVSRLTAKSLLTASPLMDHPFSCPDQDSLRGSQSVTSLLHFPFPEYFLLLCAGNGSQVLYQLFDEPFGVHSRPYIIMKLYSPGSGLYLTGLPVDGAWWNVRPPKMHENYRLQVGLFHQGTERLTSTRDVGILWARVPVSL